MTTSERNISAEDLMWAFTQVRPSAMRELQVHVPAVCGLNKLLIYYKYLLYIICKKIIYFIDIYKGIISIILFCKFQLF